MLFALAENVLALYRLAPRGYDLLSPCVEAAELQPDALLTLSERDVRFAGHKIVAVTLTSERAVLGADDDGGCATLFVLQ